MMRAAIVTRCDHPEEDLTLGELEEHSLRCALLPGTEDSYWTLLSIPSAEIRVDEWDASGDPVLDATVEPVTVHLSRDLVPQSTSTPCPGRTVAYLGFACGVVIPCGDRWGHEGPCHFHIEWGYA